MLEARIQHQFFESADLLNKAAEQLTRPLAAAAQLAVGCLTSGGRLLCAGAGLSQLDAQGFAQLLQHQFEQERPGLAALVLLPQLGALSGGAAQLRQLQVLAHPGDVLLWLDAQGQGNAQGDGAALAQAARAQDVAVIAFCGPGPDAAALKAALTDTDVLVPLGTHPSHNRLPHLLETQRTALHALCDAIDAQLLGLES